MTDDERYIQKCLELAERGKGNVAPNPMVGAVVVADGRVIGEGYHMQYGGPHAEVNAIASVAEADKHLLAKATIYVNLEPCSHFGKTPPCADLIIRTGIPRVVFASDDPNPLVSGRGTQKLCDAGIEVTTGILKKEADFLNRRFFTFITHERPYIVLKWAESQDGFMAPLEAKQVWLTGEAAKKLTHEWRAEEAAIMVGTNTVRIDDPELTVRLAPDNVPHKDHARVIIDRDLSLDPAAKVFRPGASVYVYNERENSVSGNVHRIKIDFNAGVLPEILADLRSKNIQSLFVEGGPETLAGFVSAGLWDEARVFTAERTLGQGKPAPKLSGEPATTTMIGPDKLSIFFNMLK